MLLVYRNVYKCIIITIIMKYKSLLVLISLIGSLFSGYLTYTKLFLGFCPINEGCANLWGYPVCVYGFILFFILLLSSIAFYYKDDLFNKFLILKISFIGILFSLYYAIIELFFTQNTRFSLGMPTCVYGLFMFTAIFIIHLKNNSFKCK